MIVGFIFNSGGGGVAFNGMVFIRINTVCVSISFIPVKISQVVCLKYMEFANYLMKIQE